MKIQIEQEPFGYFKWVLETGPERIHCYTGRGETLGSCFEQIIRHRTMNAMEYAWERQQEDTSRTVH